MCSRDAIATFRYLDWQNLYNVEKPYQDLRETPEGYPTTNLVFREGPKEEVHDVRQGIGDFTLDDNGFAYRTWPSGCKSFDKVTVKQIYLPEIEDLLRREIKDIQHIALFDWRLRTSSLSRKDMTPGSKIDLNDPTERLGPVREAHVDQSPAGAQRRARLALGEQSNLLEGRVRIINIWRPIKAVVEEWPLAVCDGSAVAETDLIRTDLVTNEGAGEGYYLPYNPKYRWYYLSDQKKDEVAMLKIYDSSNSVKAKCCPHASFALKTTNPTTPARESIEVRALVFSPLEDHS